MLFPLFAVGIGMLFVLFYFMRKGVTYSNDGRKGSPWVAVVIFAIFASIGWYLDVYIGFSVIPQFMLVVGGAVTTYAWFGIIGFIALMFGMLVAQLKCGRMIA